MRLRPMKRLHTVTIVTAFALCLLQACDSAGIEKLQAENTALRAQLSAAKRELDELKSGPTQLLTQAEQAAAKSDWAEAKKQVEKLMARHPSSAEATKAKQLLATADAALIKATKEAALAETRRAEVEKQQQALEERRQATALSKMNKKVDSIEEVTWYHDKSSPQYANNNGFFLYLGKRQKGDPWLRFRIQYSAENWLFIESFLVVVDGKHFNYSDVNFDRDNNSKIWEWYDEPATSRDLEMIRAIIESKNAVIRFNGRQYRRDRYITATEKAALQNVLDAYKVLGGT